MMPKQVCRHQRGDYVHGMWVCSDCFTPLTHRPYRLGMVFIFGRGQGGERQQVVWQAEVATNDKGIPFRTFMAWMVGYLRVRSRWISKDAARQQCLELLREMGEPYGSDDACWSRCDAKDLVREGITAYWDEAPSGAN